jgi:hypothetical protein
MPAAIEFEKSRRGAALSDPLLIEIAGRACIFRIIWAFSAMKAASTLTPQSKFLSFFNFLRKSRRARRE